MTDSFEYPDGHHYRCLGHGSKMDNVGNYIELMDGKMHQIEEIDGDGDCIIFERVEPPLWPWTGPSGRHYNIGDNGLHWNMQASIPPEDFAGLAERLQKQAELNQ